MAKLTFAPTPTAKVTLIANNFGRPDAQDPLGLTWASYRADPRFGGSCGLEFTLRERVLEHTRVWA